MAQVKDMATGDQVPVAWEGLVDHLVAAVAQQRIEQDRIEQQGKDAR